MRYQLAVVALLLCGLARGQEMELQVELLKRVGTDTNRKGDMVAARIVSPAGFQGSTIEGKVTESISGTQNRGQSSLEIDFDIINHGGAVIPVNSRTTSVINAKGEISPRSAGDSHELQRMLLEAEGVDIDLRGRIDLARFRWKAKGTSPQRR